MFTLTSFLPIKRMQKIAVAEALEVVGRFDVPQHNPQAKSPADPGFVHEDLRDTAPRFFRTKSGGRITQRLLADDLGLGAESSSNTVLLGGLVLLSLLAASLTAAGMLTAGDAVIGFGVYTLAVLAWVAVLLLSGILYESIGVDGHRLLLMAAVFLPIVGVASGLLNGLSALSSGPLAAISPMVSALPSMALSGIAVVAFGAVLVVFRPRLETIRNLIILIVGFAAFSTASKILLPSWAHGAAWIALAAGVPFLWAFKEQRKRDLRLLEQGGKYTKEDTGPLSGSHIKARADQVEATNRDTSPIITLGETTGHFTKFMDGFASDAWQKFCMSVDDLSTNLLITGKIGSGKTILLRSIVRQWMANAVGGIFIFCGKGSLPRELLEGNPDATLIKPGMPLGLIEGLTPEQIASALGDVGGSSLKANSGQSAGASFFKPMAQIMMTRTAVALEARIDIENKMVADGLLTMRRTQKTLDAINRLATALQNKSEQAEKFLAELETHPMRNTGGALDDTIHYWKNVVWPMPDEQKGGIFGTIQSWITPVMSSPELLPWAKTEHGIDVTDVLRGAKMGMSLPEEKFGVAGTLCQTLIKQRLYGAAMLRGTYDWQEKGEVPVMFCVDEAQDLGIGVSDRKMLPKGRSLGARCVYATQMVDSFVARMGKDETDEFVGSFRSKISFKSSLDTYTMMKEELGSGNYLSWKRNTVGIDFVGSLKQLASQALFDTSHPARRFYKKLLRLGAGSFESSGEQANVARKVAQGGKHSGHTAWVDSSKQTAFATPLSEGGEWKERPLLTEAEWDTVLAEKFVAVAQVMRGGVPRRDIIKLTNIQYK
jgi:hypothetical protein